MPRPFVHERKVGFEDVDAARIVFFARFFHYCHDAMEALFDPLEGGYVRLINERRIGLPAVHVDADFTSPLRYGDAMRILVDVPHLGNSSATLRYRFSRLADGAAVATVTHVVVATNLDAIGAIPLPDDVRATLATHAVTKAKTPAATPAKGRRRPVAAPRRAR